MRALAFLAILLSANCSAVSGVRYADWQADTAGPNDSVFVAETANDSGDSFGLACTDTNCFWMVVPASLTCEDKSSYVGLVNTPAGAMMINFDCAHLQGSSTRPVLTLNETKDVNSVIGSGPIIGIALALKDGQFRVLRFSTKGAMDAIRVITQMAIDHAKKGTKDTNL